MGYTVLYDIIYIHDNGKVAFKHVCNASTSAMMLSGFRIGGQISSLYLDRI